MIWFTSDHHFGHANIIEFCDRPFDTVEEMDWQLIDNWNRVVDADDIVYHLGDFTLGNIGIANRIFRQLCGQIKVIPGGHDWRWLEDFTSNIKSASEYSVEILPPLFSLEIPTAEKYPFVIVLCHYAMRVWDRSHYGSWHLYGHSHGRLPPWENSMDVGIDSNEFIPVNLETVLIQRLQV